MFSSKKLSIAERERLLRLAEAARPSRPAAGTAPIGAADRSQPLPLSFAQQRLWFLAQMGDAGQAYHLPMSLRLSGTLDRAALRAALARIVDRHEALRTSYPMVDGTPEQRIAPAGCGVALHEQDLRGRPDAQTVLQQLMQDEAAAPFDLDAGAPLRGRLVALDEAEHVLLLTLHHIASDGWSLALFTHELVALYRAFAEGRPDPLPPLAIQYVDYAAWQRQRLKDDALQLQADHWRRVLAGAPVLLTLPTDRARPAEQDQAGRTVSVEVDAPLTAQLRELARRHGTTLFMTVLAGWAAVLSRLSGQSDLVIGTPVANRTRAEFEPLIGLFANTLALRLDLGGQPSVAQLLQRVKERSLAAQEHQDLPFEQVVEIVNPPRSLSHSPLFQVLFSWQAGGRGDTLELPGLRLEPLAAPQVSAQFDLTLNLVDAGDRLLG
ncbi:partial arthrofactin-type cyclic lipopeptide synthetase C, partial [Burkholderiaceae bacterium]